MGLIYVPSRRIRARFKPDFHYRINPELKDGLDFLLDFNGEGAVLNKGNFNPGRSITPVNNSLSVGLGGKGSKCSSTTRSYLESNCPTLPTSDGAGGGDYSILVVLDHPSAASRQFAYHSRKNSGGFNSSFAIANGYYASGGSTGLNESGALWLGDYDGVTGSAQGVKASGVLDGGVHCALLTKSVVSGTNYWNLYVDGILIGSSSYAGARTVYDASQLLSINGFATADSFVPGGRTYLVATFRKALDSIAPDLSAAPYKTLLEPYRRAIWAPVSAGSTASGAASGNEVTTSSVIGSSLFNGVLSGNEVTTSSIVGASTHDTVASGNAVVASSVIGASTFDGAASGNAVVTSSIVGDSVAAGSAVASGNAVVTSSIIGASVFNGIALGDIVVTGDFVGQGANTAGAASGAIVVTGGFVGQGATSTTLTSADLDAIWDVELETGYTARQMMRIMFSALAGKRSGLGTSTESYYDVATGTIVRISLTPDANGNGTPVVDGT